MKDFVGARLEAEETLRKKHAAALLESAIRHQETTPGCHPSPSDESITSRRHENQQQLQPETSPSSESRTQHAKGDENGHHQLCGTSKQDAAPSWAAATAVPHNIGATASLGTSYSEESPPDDRQTGHGGATILFSALRQREQELPSRVALLDDRMKRVRPMGLLAKGTAAAVDTTPSVSVSALVSDSSPLAPGLPTSRIEPTKDQSLATGAAEEVAAALLTVDPAVGTPFGGGALGNGFLGIASMTESATMTSTPGRYRHGQRRRRMSVPLLLPLAVDDARTGDDAGAGTKTREMRRPWTTPYGERVADEVQGGGGVAVTAFRYDSDSGDCKFPFMYRLPSATCNPYLPLIRWIENKSPSYNFYVAIRPCFGSNYCVPNPRQIQSAKQVDKKRQPPVIDAGIKLCPLRCPFLLCCLLP